MRLAGLVLVMLVGAACPGSPSSSSSSSSSSSTGGATSSAPPSSGAATSGVVVGSSSAASSGGGGSSSAQPPSSSSLPSAGTSTSTTVTSGDSSSQGGSSTAGTSVPDVSSSVAGSSSAPPASSGFPLLGVYTVHTDGTQLRLLLDSGTRELSHPRLQEGSNWVAATRYSDDADHNGLAMEDEIGVGADYLGTEIVVFPMDNPTAVTLVAGTTAGGTAANPSWTADGRLLYLQQDPGTAVDTIHLQRTLFSTVPNVASVEVVPVPAGLVVPVDPHQHGNSDGTGFITFSATFSLSGMYMRPLWQMPASGGGSLSIMQLVGCPLCASGCCGFPTPEAVLGTNDSRINHAGTQVTWMQQSPNVVATFGTITFNPYRQWKSNLVGGPQVDLTPAGLDPVTQLAYAEWRPDDQELTYWAIVVEGNAAKNHLYTSNVDGTVRTQIPLPAELCPQHASYISPTELIFNAWHCGGANCSCDVAFLSRG